MQRFSTLKRLTNPSSTSVSATTSPLARPGQQSESRRYSLQTSSAVGILTAALLAIAVVLRTVQYLWNTSLSVDEAALALNVLHRPYSHLLDQLDFNQGAPPAFLFLEKLAFDLFGNTEYSFRAVPLAAGIIAGLLMIPFARRFLGHSSAVLLAVGLFAFSQVLILFAATGKQYTLDVVATLVLYILALNVLNDRGARSIAILAIIGAAAVWISFASVFVLAGIGSTLIARSALLHRWRDATLQLSASLCWLASFGALYVVSVQDLGHLQNSIADTTGTDGGRVRVLQTLVGALRSDLGIAHLQATNYDLGRIVAVVAIALVLVGFVTLLKERLATAALVITPALFMLCAFEFGKYPLFPRTLLFLTPVTIVLLASGAMRLAAASPGSRMTSITATSLVCVFIVLPSLKDVAQPQRTAELKPVLRYLAKHQQMSDTLWVDQPTQYALRYYLECRCFGDARLVRRGELLWPLRPASGGAGQFSPALESVLPRFVVSRAIGFSTGYRSELRALRGRRRVWILISDVQRQIREPILSFAGTLGVQGTGRRASSSEIAAAVYLYDFHRP